MEKNRGISKTIIIVGVITSFITTFMGSGLNLSVPAMEDEFGVSTRSIGWVVTVYMITCAALAVPFGRLADKLGRKIVLIGGLFLFTAGSALAVISRGMWVLLVFRFIQAVGASMIFSTNVAMMAASAEESRRGRIVGLAASANYVGLAAGPVLGGMLSYNFGWRAIFIVTAAVSGIALILALFRLPAEAGRTGQKRQVTGIRELFRNRAYVCANLAALINYGANYTISYILSIYLQTVRGMSAQSAGFVLVTSTVVMAVLAPVSGRLSDRLVPQRISAAGMAVCSLALALLAFLPENCSLVRIVIILAVAGLGFAMFSSPNTNAVMACVKKEDYGLASSVLATMRSLGNTVSMAVVTSVVGLYMGSGSLKNAEPEVIMQTMHTVYFVFTILCILGIFMANCRKV